jgi:hypothetical protein
MTTTPPPEPPEGQDPEPPDLDLLLHAVRVLLRDVALRLDPDDTGADDLALRARAVRRAVVRAIVNREGA